MAEAVNENPKIEWHNERRKIDDLIPFSHNPRAITDKQREDLKKSLEKFGLAEVPAINTDNTILAGHQRLKILQLLGRGKEEIDVRVPNRLLSEAEAKEYNIRSNKNTGYFDDDILAEYFSSDELKEWGFESDELDKLFKDDRPEADDVPEPRKETDIKLGDLFQLGDHRLLCGDATKKEDVERLMDGKKADMVFDEIVLDLFGGSGSTIIACEQLNRKCFMMELDSIYCQVIIDRWEKFTGNKAKKI
jgi:hypothetical protein